ncbi:MAG TPA: MFS transporter [Verrucomicrobiae bacterium]|jgi:maltose/moltooligosaccharide transporter|nr:MFS transporter [Verrucomicrobiae bacterium]
MEKPRPSLLQIWNMNFGFLGIQFGWGLQLANMSAIYAKLGANSDKIPILWLAGPITGLLVQPLIGSMSDRTWNRLGRRRPYFLAGAILSSLGLFFMPDAPAVWAAAMMLWILDASINVSMEPFRAFVADKLPLSQRTTGFVMQSFFIGLGATVANALPWLLQHNGVTGNAANGVPLAVQYSFKLGAAVFLLAVLWTIFTTPEYPPENMEEFLRQKTTKTPWQIPWNFILTGAAICAVVAGLRGQIADHSITLWHVVIGAILGAAIGWVLGGRHVGPAVKEMPSTMKQLAVVQFFSWMGLFCMWMFFGLATAQQVFGTTDSKSPAFDEGTIFGGGAFAWYSVVCFIAAFFLPPLARMIGRKWVHALALICGGAGLLATGVIHDRVLWQCTMIGVGIAWASILAMPYSILSGALPPARMGVYMGIFNFFIVLPEIILSITLGPIVREHFANDPVKVVMLGGLCMIIAAVATTRVTDIAAVPTSPEHPLAEPAGA